MELKHIRAFCFVKITLLTVLLLNTLSVFAAKEYAAESVLASGKWVKIQVSESGIHQISRSTLSSWGFSDISKVKIFGYGGAMLSEQLSSNDIDDLPQLPVYRSADKIIFYAQGPVAWKDQTGQLRFEHYQNPYADKGYYFVTDRNDIEEVVLEETGDSAESAEKAITTFPERLYHEQDLFAPGTTGRLLLGEDFRTKKSQTFTFLLSGLMPETTPTVKVRFTSTTSGASAKVTATVGNETVGSMTISPSSGNYAIGRTSHFIGHIKKATEKTQLTINYTPSGSVSVAGLDYICINYSRRLELTDKSLEFRSYTPQCRDSVFSVNRAKEGTIVWDITETNNPMNVRTTHKDNTLSFRQTIAGRREYVAFNPSATFPSPKSAGSVANQNIHAKATPTMLIITPSAFRQQAERLAELHRTADEMIVEVLTDEQIFNEFSSGTPDAMAYRKVGKMWYDRSKTAPDFSKEKFRYLLLFGRCVFDNRRITSAAKTLKYPMLFTWESPDSDSETSSFNTDDAFGFLEEGTDISSSSQKRMSIGVGRIPVKNVDEAKTMVDKIYNYMNTPDMGSWKSRVLVIADDADSGIHMDDSNRTIDNINAYGGQDYLIKRVFIDAYKTSSNGSGHTYPEAREQMMRSFREGVIFANYLGHANPTSWTHNELLRWPDITDGFHYRHEPLMFTGTCEFTRWDAPDVSGGEELLLYPRGGVIAIITSSRVTGMSSNGQLSIALGKHVFNPLSNGEMPRLGDILKNTKNDPDYNSYFDSTGRPHPTNVDHSMKYALLGDPALRLKYPRHSVKLTEINGSRTDSEILPEIKARQEVEMKGIIVDKSGNRLTNYNGLLTATVFDAEISVSTNGNDDNGTNGKVVTFQEHNNQLYIGSDSIRNGEFSIRFRMPTAIVNNYTPGLVNLFAQSDTDGDALGKSENFYVYGFDESETDDNEGPEINLFALNTESFANGDNVNETPYVIAKFSDRSGINLSTLDIGHGITLTLDGKTTITGLESFYSQGSDKTASINYQMSDLTEGAHSLKLRVWDVFGNMSEKEISFNVIHGLEPQLFEIYSNANPAKTKADFFIRHNRPDALLTINITVYDMLGHTIWTTTETGRADLYTSMPVTWNLTDGSGRRVQRGIYLYRATVSSDGSAESSITQRIAVASE